MMKKQKETFNVLIFTSIYKSISIIRTGNKIYFKNSKSQK
jgi:hypothetical protein